MTRDVAGPLFVVSIGATRHSGGTGIVEPCSALFRLMALLTRSDLCELFSISSSTLDRWIADGRIPPATHRLGPRSPRWSRESIQEVLNSAQRETFR